MIQDFLSRPLVFMASLALLVLATLGLLVLAPAVALLPVAAVVGGWWVCQQKIRTLALALFAMAVTVDLVTEVPYEGHWQSPLYFPGLLLFTKPGMSLPLIDLATVGLLGLNAYRRAMGITIDGPPTPPLPKPLVLGLLLQTATILWVQVWGIYINGGNSVVAKWQWHQMLVIPLLIALFNVALRGPEDFRTIGRIVIVGCCVKAFLGAFFILTIARPRGLYHEYATTHSDTVLYVTGLVIAVSSWMEQPIRKNFWRMVWVCSVILMGMHYNDRRLAYVSFTLSLIAVYVVSPWSWVKRYATRAGMFVAPLFPFYLAVGWQNPTGIFGIVGIFKSLVEGENLQKGQLDYRDIENIDVVYTWEQHPILGTGWGHPFLEKIKLPDISHAFADYLYHPHNSVLGMLAYGGIVGFSGIWAWISIAMFLTVRAYHRAHEPEARAGGLVAMSVIVAYINQCFGDMGTISWLGTILVAMAATCSGKLATVTNAWPAPQPRRKEVSETEKSASPVGNLV
ncbi:exopolysaccharide repeat unit polymerase [Archangium lansingense]|uniref:exopolysaccharide repeat unit polymerase n=1 Tax=Archangium lansingense TaxID=2995310 RepID=UPI003B7A9AD5